MFLEVNLFVQQIVKRNQLKGCMFNQITIQKNVSEFSIEGDVLSFQKKLLLPLLVLSSLFLSSCSLAYKEHKMWGNERREMNVIDYGKFNYEIQKKKESLYDIKTMQQVKVESKEYASVSTYMKFKEYSLAEDVLEFFSFVTLFTPQVSASNEIQGGTFQGIVASFVPGLEAGVFDLAAYGDKKYNLKFGEERLRDSKTYWEARAVAKEFTLKFALFNRQKKTFEYFTDAEFKTPKNGRITVDLLGLIESSSWLSNDKIFRLKEEETIALFIFSKEDKEKALKTYVFNPKELKQVQKIYWVKEYGDTVKNPFSLTEL